MGEWLERSQGSVPGARKVAFIAGLPRSGSTLFAALLRQNPEIHADITSPVYSLVDAVFARCSGATEFLSCFDDPIRERLMRGIFPGFYGERWRGIVFDTNRLWCSRMELLERLFPDFKLIAFVRPIVEIVASFEHILASNPLVSSRLFKNPQGMTVYERAEALLSSSNGVIGRPLASLKQAYFGPLSKKILLVSYERFVADPRHVVEQVYKFLDEPMYAHTFGDLSFDRPQYDLGLGLQGLHRVRSSISKVSRPDYLPPDLASRLAQAPFWTIDGPRSAAERIV